MSNREEFNPPQDCDIAGDLLDRTAYLDAAIQLGWALGMPHETHRVYESALRLGFAIGNTAQPELYVPAMVVAKVVEAREAQKSIEGYQRAMNQPGVVCGSGGGIGMLGGRPW
jgi:hypothetical protein